ncbi:MAG: DNA ligase D [Ferruginibacter sp.]
MLAKESIEAFDDDAWIFEIKWDGFRALAETGKDIKLYSRNGNSFVHSYPVVVKALSRIKLEAVLDGEIVVLNEDGFPDFQKIQDYENHTHLPLHFYVFDLLSLKGKKLHDLPLTARKDLLKKLIGKNEIIKYSDHISGTGKDFFNVSVQRNLEGIMAKKADSQYYPGRRTNEWLKIKNNKTADVIIVGYTEPGGSRNHFGSLVLGIKDGNFLNHAGNAGTGYDEKKLKEIFNLLQPIRRDTCPITGYVKIPGVTWVEPEFVCEVKFTEWTKDSKLRHPVFIRLRNDKNINDSDMKEIKPVKHASKKVTLSKLKKNKIEKLIKPSKKKVISNAKTVKKTAPVKTIVLETEADSNKKAKELSVLQFGKVSVAISNRQKTYFPDDGITKGMVIDYYQSVAEYILPYLQNRPQSLKRNPGGIKDFGFFHKDAGDIAPSWVKSFKVHSESTNKMIDYIICNDKATLAYLNNLGCIELNPWHSVTSKPDKPDYLIIDIDPSDNNTFEQVIETAQHFKKLLDKAEAPSFCKTSGASGLHIYVPMGKKFSYEQAKDFAHVLCMLVSEQLPDFTTLERNLKKRGNNHMYLDYLQNRRGQTIASVYSLRPRIGATVSMPLLWKEVKKGLTPADFTIRNALKRIIKMGDIFKGILGPGIDISKCLNLLGEGQ